MTFVRRTLCNRHMVNHYYYAVHDDAYLFQSATCRFILDSHNMSLVTVSHQCRLLPHRPPKLLSTVQIKLYISVAHTTIYRTIYKPADIQYCFW